MKKKRFICLLLALAMCLSIMPITIMADDEPPEAALHQYLKGFTMERTPKDSRQLYLLSNGLPYEEFKFDPSVTKYDIMLVDAAPFDGNVKIVATLNDSFKDEENLYGTFKNLSDQYVFGKAYSKGSRDSMGALIKLSNNVKMSSTPYTLKYVTGFSNTTDYMTKAYEDADTYTFNFYRKATLSKFEVAYEGGTKILELTVDTTVKDPPADGEFDPYETEFTVKNVKAGTKELYITAPAQTQDGTTLKFYDGNGNYTKGSTVEAFTLDLTKYTPKNGSIIVPFDLDYDSTSGGGSGVDGHYTLTVSFEEDADDSAVSPTTASFDKYTGSTGYQDIPVTLTLNGNTLSGIWNGSTQLPSDAYTISDNTEVVLLKTYLDSLPTGSTPLTFKFSGGADQTLIVTVSDTTPASPNDSAVSPTTASFDKYTGSTGYQDIPVTLTLNGNTLSGIWNGSTQLTSGDYTISDDTEIVLLRTYLDDLSTGDTELTFKFSGGADQTLAVTVSDTTPGLPVDFIEDCLAKGFVVQKTGTVYTLTGYTGTATEIEIPDGITAIGSRAFFQNKVITKITIPASVTSVGESAFYYTTLEMVVFEVRGTDLTIGKFAFGFCNGLRSIELPSTLTSIGELAFSSSSALRSVKISDKSNSKLTNIGDQAFAECGALESIDTSDTLTSIGYRAFYHCSALEAIDIPDTLTSMGREAFNGCSSLTYVNIPKGLTSIPDRAFVSAKLEEIELPPNLETIGNFAFAASPLTSLEIPATVTSIGDSAFAGAKLKEIELPLNLKAIGNSVFAASPLTSLEIPATVTSIGNSAFAGAKLEEIELPPNLETIGSSAFSSSPLTSLEIPATVTSIGYSTFSSATFTEVRLLNPNIALGTAASFAFSGIKNLTIDMYSTAPGYQAAYLYVNGNPDLNMKMVLLDPESENVFTVMDDDYHVFNGELLLYTGKGGEITIPEGITAINGDTFRVGSTGRYPADAKLLTSVTLSDSLVSIGAGMFSGQTELAGELIIPALVSNITGSYAASSFQNTKIAKITVLSNAESPALTLGNYAFANMQHLEEIHCERPIVLGQNSFQNDAMLTIVSLPKMTEEISEGTFLGCSNLKTLTIPEGVVSTGQNQGGNGHFSGTGIRELLFPTTFITAGVNLSKGSKLESIAFLSDTLTFNSKSFTIGGETPFPAVYVYPDTSTHTKFKNAKGDAAAVAENLRFLSYSLNISAQDEEGTSLYSNPTLKADWDNAVKAGYTKDIVPSFAPAVLDALVAAHVDKYGAEGLSENLSLDSNGNITKAFGQEGNWNFTYGGDHYSGKQASSVELGDGKNLIFYIGAAPEESPTVLGSMVITGDIPYDTLTPILGTSIYAGSFSAVGAAKRTQFVSNLYEYDYYVNPGADSVRIDLGIKNVDESAKLRLAYSVDGTPMGSDIEPSDNAWAGVEVDLTAKSTTVEFTVSTIEDPGATTTYMVHIIKGDLEPLKSTDGTGVIAFEGRYVKGDHSANTTITAQQPLERLTDWGPYSAPPTTISAYLYKNEQKNVIIDITVEKDVEVTFDSTKTDTDGSHKIKKRTVTTKAGREFVQFEVNYDLGDVALKGGALPSVPGINIKNGGNIRVQNIALEYRADIDGVYTPDKLVDIHVGNPSQFGSGIKAASRSMKAVGSWALYVSLGGLGGYATYMFDEPIKNDPRSPYGIDFVVTGNRGTGSEPGSVEVSKDGKTWYYLAGSMHYELTNKFRNVQLYPEPRPGVIVRTMEIYKGDSYPSVEGLSFGYIDVAVCTDYGEDYIEGGGPVYGKSRNPYIANSYDARLDVMDINWAVDEDGKPVYLDEISYIRVQNVIDSTAFGGLSPEIGTMVRTDNYKADEALAITEAPKTLEVAGVDILAETTETIEEDGFLAEYIKLNVPTDDLAAVIVNVEAENKGTNIFVNKMRYDDKATYTGMFADGGDLTGLYNKPGELLLRVVVQRGDLHPRIYVVKVTGGDPDAAAKNAEISKIRIIPGDVDLTQTDDGYTATVANSVAKAQLVTYLVNPDATITVDGQAVVHGETSDPLSLDVGENEFEVVVTSSDGTVTNNTKVIITRESTSPGTIPDNTISVWFTFTGDDIHYIMNPTDRYLPGTSTGPHNSKAWISRQRVRVPKDSTAKYLTDMMLLNNGIKFSSRDGGTYIEWVMIPSGSGNTPVGEKLAEFSNGPNSGWMYRVNGIIVSRGYAEQILTDGDEVLWFYTDDYTAEKNYEDGWNPGNPVGGSTGNSGTIVTPTVTATGGTAAVTVKASDLTNAISNAKKNGGNITITPEITGTANKVTVELPKSSLSTIASDTSSALSIQTPVGTVTLPNTALESIASQASGSTVTVSLNTVSTATLTPDQQKAVGSSTVYDISVLSGTTHISSFGGSSITISLPYTLRDGEDVSGVTVWYMDDSGELRQMTATYDKTTGLASFTTAHLSYYLVGYTTAWTNPFTDVKTGDWYYDAVKYASQNGLFNGTTATTFGPNTDMTRAMLVTVLYRLEGKPTVTGTNTFTDVKSGEWYTDAVLWANANNIVGGYGNGLFGTNDSVTREQMALILHRYAQYKGYDVSRTTALSAYTDASGISSYAQIAMKWANAEELITGRTTTTLAPAGSATRAEVASILMRFVDNVAK